MMDRTEELFNEMLDKYDPELILGALDEMSRMGKEQLIELRNVCEKMNIAEEAKNHQPD
ncbi:hypothetical protein [Psychrobacillus sp. BM2]|uniref:hypothetical protein n=1 Tax=Psychrobacillus sp. BM2 TaxID=3400421 RepID=UPI003B01765C